VKRRITAVRSLIALALLSAGLTAFAFAATTPTTASKPASTKPATKTTTAKPSTGTATHKPGTTSTAKKTAAKPGRPPIEQAFAARQLEDGGAYGRAADELKVLRKMVKIDGDLELALALDEARSGRSDSALARLSTPMMEAAANDSMPLKRRAEYPYQRETFWIDGKFDGWNWYILRARGELEASVATGRKLRRGAPGHRCVGAERQGWHILAAAPRMRARRLARQATAKRPARPHAARGSLPRRLGV
jgi:hypothetical protein